MDHGKITVAMITMNEEGAIERVVQGIRKVVPGAEILIVDSSSDNTPEIAKKIGIRVIRQYPPIGYGPAMALALRSAKGEVIVTLDCDGTYPVESIPVLAQMVLSGDYDLVDATRLGSRPQAMPFINYLANWGFAFMASVLFRTRLTDLHSGMRAYRANMLSALQFQERGAALPVELLLRPLSKGYKVKSIPIGYFERVGESKMQPLAGAWWTLKRMLKVRLGVQ